MPPLSRDLVDERVMEELQADGRLSFREIARRIGVSEGTVRSRYRRLESAGVLRVLAFVDPVRLDRRVLAMITAKVDNEHVARIAAAAAAWPETTYVSTLMGRADIYLQVICADNETLGAILSRLRSLPGVVETEAMLEMKVHKFAYRDLAARDAEGPGA
jgi:Lrp/AsnC family transcriptional regulator for asnA, asnC and gidA